MESDKIKSGDAIDHRPRYSEGYGVVHAARVVGARGGGDNRRIARNHRHADRNQSRKAVLGAESFHMPLSRFISFC
jgi:hypothetical protein